MILRAFLLALFPLLSLNAQQRKLFYSGNVTDTTSELWEIGFSGTNVWDFRSGSMEQSRTHTLTMDFDGGTSAFYWNDEGSVRLCSNSSWISNVEGDTISWLLEKNRGEFSVNDRGYGLWNNSIFGIVHLSVSG